MTCDQYMVYCDPSIHLFATHGTYLLSVKPNSNSLPVKVLHHIRADWVHQYKAFMRCRYSVSLPFPIDTYRHDAH